MSPMFYCSTILTFLLHTYYFIELQAPILKIKINFFLFIDFSSKIYYKIYTNSMILYIIIFEDRNNKKKKIYH